MDVENERTKDMEPEILAAFQDLARLSHRHIRNGVDEPPQVVSALLERLQRLCQATLGAIFLTTVYPGDHVDGHLRGVLPFSLHGKLYRPLALHGIEEKDGAALLASFSSEMPWTSRPMHHPAWLVWRLPLVLSFSAPQNEDIKRHGRELVDEAIHMPRAFLLFGWEKQDGEQRAAALEQGRLLLQPLADAVGTILVQSLAHEYISELETRVDRKALREMEFLKAELLASVSHELRSPLTSIKGYAATLLRHERRISREERHEFLLAINDASDRLAGVIDALLEMAELEMESIEIKSAPVDLFYVVREAVVVAEQRLGEEVMSLAVAPSAHKQPTFDVLHEKTSPDGTRDPELIIQADQNRLREVLDQLLENAIKHMPGGGTIHVLACVVCSAKDIIELAEFLQDGGARLGLALQRYQRMAVIAVQDSGKGIPADVLERIFDPFYRVDTRLTREVNGLGLGLAICRRIIKLHDGMIWAESEAGKGSTFFVCLPLNEKD